MDLLWLMVKALADGEGLIGLKGFDCMSVQVDV